MAVTSEKKEMLDNNTVTQVEHGNVMRKRHMYKHISSIYA